MVGIETDQLVRTGAITIISRTLVIQIIRIIPPHGIITLFTRSAAKNSAGLGRGGAAAGRHTTLND